MLNILKPTKDDIMIDMALGAGIFTKEYFKYIKKNNSNISNKEIVKNIHGVEIEKKAF
jgi:hypothetical protein